MLKPPKCIVLFGCRPLLENIVGKLPPRSIFFQRNKMLSVTENGQSLALGRASPNMRNVAWNTSITWPGTSKRKFITFQQHPAQQTRTVCSCMFSSSDTEQILTLSREKCISKLRIHMCGFFMQLVHSCCLEADVIIFCKHSWNKKFIQNFHFSSDKYQVHFHRRIKPISQITLCVRACVCVCSSMLGLHSGILGF